MKKIGNIVTKYKGKYSQLFNVVNSYDNIISGLPTLIIGFENAKSTIKDFNILKKSYPEQNIWWTYNKTERRCDFDSDVDSFYNETILNTVSGVSYFYVDITNYGYNRLKSFINYIMSKSKKLLFSTRGNNFLFIYDESLSTVFGLSLTLCEYFGINRKHVVGSILKNRNNTFVKDLSFITPELRYIIGNNTHYILPLYAYFQNV